MSAETKGTLENVLQYWPIISALVVFLAGQVVSYLKLRAQVADVLRGLNGLGSKVRDLGHEVAENEIENIYRMNGIGERIARIEGILETLYSPRQKNGEA